MTSNPLLIVAHRGASVLAPENSLAAGRAAKRVGARGWEFDVQSTRDGCVVLMHDDTPARTTDVARVFPERADRPVSDFTLDELRRLDVGARFVRPAEADRLGIDPLAPEPVPMLDEALALARATGLLIFPELNDHRLKPVG